jgi:hypothetical protein
MLGRNSPVGVPKERFPVLQGLKPDEIQGAYAGAQ